MENSLSGILQFICPKCVLAVGFNYFGLQNAKHKVAESTQKRRCFRLAAAAKYKQLC